MGPRARERFAALVAYLAFAAVLTAIEAVAIRGQLDFARFELALVGAWRLVVPVALEGAALTWAALALWSAITRDSAAMARIMTAASVLAAAAANWMGAQAAGRPTAGAAYMAGFSIAALLMWHAILTRVRRAELRALGALEAPLPRFRPLRWVVAPKETRRAWVYAIREGITSPEQALSLVRGEAVATPAPPVAVEAPADLSKVSKRQAVEYAASVLGTYEVTPVREWLAQNHQITVDKSHACRVLNDLSRGEARKVKAVQLRALEGGAES
jgi:hypothetical protein